MTSAPSAPPADRGRPARLAVAALCLSAYGAWFSWSLGGRISVRWLALGLLPGLAWPLLLTTRGQALALAARRHLAWCVAATAHVALGAPWFPDMPDAGLDASWQLALHHALLQGWKFGSDACFSFGPLGFVYTDVYVPGTFGLLLAARTACALLTAHLLWGMARAAHLSPWRAAAWSSGLALLALGVDVRLYALVLAFLLGRTTASRATLLVASAALGGALLTKFSVGVAGAAVLGLTALEDLRRRRPPAAALAASGALLCLWLLCGQPPTGLFDYLRGCAEVASGYGEAMSLTPPDWYHSIFELAGLWCCVALVAWRLLPGDRLARAATALGLLGLSLLVAKAGFVRQDAGHVWLALATYGVALGMVALPALASPERTTPPGAARSNLVAACGVVAALLLCAGLTRATGADPLLLHLHRLLGAPVRPIEGLFAWASGDLRARYEATLAEIRRVSPLAARARGTVDVFPTSMAVPLAHGLHFTPRPVWQSYVAYTPRLLRRNEEWLRGPRAPDSVLLHLGPIDGHLVTQEDGPCWPLLRARYDVAGVDSSLLLLTRRASPRAARLVPLVDREVGFEEPVQFPAVDLLWATVDVRLTAAGRALLAAYKVPPLELVVTNALEEQYTARLVRATAGEGFLLSPSIHDLRDVEAFLRGARATRPVPVRLALRLTGSAALAGLVYEPRARVTLAHVLIE